VKIFTTELMPLGYPNPNVTHKIGLCFGSKVAHYNY